MKKKPNASVKKGFSKTQGTLLRIFNIPYWFDWDRVKAGTLYLRGAAVRIFTPDKKIKDESFDAAVRRLQLNDTELLIKQKALFRLSILMLSAACLIFAYSLYHLLYGSFQATLISLVVMGIALVLAFRYHFWYFQIKNRQLGCTFHEWLKALKGGSHE